MAACCSSRLKIADSFHCFGTCQQYSCGHRVVQCHRTYWQLYVGDFFKEWSKQRTVSALRKSTSTSSYKTHGAVATTRTTCPLPLCLVEVLHMSRTHINCTACRHAKHVHAVACAHNPLTSACPYASNNCLIHLALQWCPCLFWPSVTCAGGHFLPAAIYMAQLLHNEMH